MLRIRINFWWWRLETPELIILALYRVLKSRCSSPAASRPPRTAGGRLSVSFCSEEPPSTSKSSKKPPINIHYSVLTHLDAEGVVGEPGLLPGFFWSWRVDWEVGELCAGHRHGVPLLLLLTVGGGGKVPVDLVIVLPTHLGKTSVKKKLFVSLEFDRSGNGRNSLVVAIFLFLCSKLL